MKSEVAERTGFSLGRMVGSPVAWTVVATLMAALLTGDENASRLGWLIFVLFGGYILLWVAAHRWKIRERLDLHGPLAVIVYLVVGLAAGVVYELTLTTGGEGFGGLHEDMSTTLGLGPLRPINYPAIVCGWLTM